MTPLEKMASAYRPQYGDETDALFKALANPTEKVALINPFLTKDQLAPLIAQGQDFLIENQVFYKLPKECKPVAIDGLMSHYFLDLSSVFAPLLLPLKAKDKMLDMCAAPGGKLLVVLSQKLPDLFITANDISHARSNRLKNVLREFVPEQLVGQMHLTVKDAHFFGLKRPGSFDAILLDAPCSSEAHVIKNERLLNQFSGLSKSLPKRQYSLLSAALLALREGGYVMYATCSINKHENEGVIERILHKKSDQCELVELKASRGSQSPYGVTILPDKDGAGPAFFSLLRRRAKISC